MIFAINLISNDNEKFKNCHSIVMPENIIAIFLDRLDLALDFISDERARGLVPQREVLLETRAFEIAIVRIVNESLPTSSGTSANLEFLFRQRYFHTQKLG